MTPPNTVNRREADLLQARYKGLPDDAFVAYVDESYRLPSQCRGTSDQPFYVMTAVLLRTSDHAGIRRDLEQMAGAGPWHTVDRQQTQTGRHDVVNMIDYLADYRDACILAVSFLPTPTDTGITMRHACLQALLIELGKTEPAPDVTGPIPLIVFEKQRENADTDRDRYTISQARKAGHIARGVAAHWVSPTVENLLWLPDLVSNAYNRYATRGDELVTRLDTQTSTIKVPLNASDPLAAVAHVQGVSLLFPEEEQVSA